MDICCSQHMQSCRHTNLGISLWCSDRVVKGTATSVIPTHIGPTHVGPTYVGLTYLVLNHIQFDSIIVLNSNIVINASVIFTVINTTIYNVMRVFIMVWQCLLLGSALF